MNCLHSGIPYFTKFFQYEKEICAQLSFASTTVSSALHVSDTVMKDGVQNVCVRNYAYFQPVTAML